MGEYHSGWEDENGDNPGDMVMAQVLEVEMVSNQDIRLRIRAPLVHATWMGELACFLTPALDAVGLKFVTSGLSIVDIDQVTKWRVSSTIQSPMEPGSSITLVFDVAEEEQMIRDVELVAIRTRLSMIEGLVLQKREDGMLTCVGRFTAWELAARPFIEGDQVEFVLA
jgi:hypothetical protein